MNALALRFSGGRSLDDWLSPILVKELRQGMRARVFVISFLLLQLFLGTLVLANVAAQYDRDTLEEQNHFFWVILGFALLVLTPLRSLVAISHEVKNRTMETVLLTRLTAWRVVFGKWSALFAQSLLLVSAVLPYVVLRYFIGGDDIVSDLEWILVLLWFSGVLIAAGIAISALTNVIIRIVIFIGIAALFSVGSDNLFGTGFFMGGPWTVLGWLALFGFFIPALLFEIAASTLAPASENHALRRRLLALAFFGAAWGFSVLTNNDFKAGVIIPVFVAVGICAMELAEKPRLVPRMVRTFAVLGPLSRPAALFLLPGWPGGFLFSILVIPLVIIAYFVFVPHGTDNRPGLVILATFGSLFVPAFLCHTFWPRMNQVLLMVVLYNVILLALASVLEGFATLTQTHIDPFLGFLPSLPVLSVAMNAAGTAFHDEAPWYIFGNACVDAIVGLALLAGAARHFREVFALLRPPAPAPAAP